MSREIQSKRHARVSAAAASLKGNILDLDDVGALEALGFSRDQMLRMVDQAEEEMRNGPAEVVYPSAEESLREILKLSEFFAKIDTERIEREVKEYVRSVESGGKAPS